MRILFTFAGGLGHLEPLVPLANAAEVAGHEVAFVGRPWMVPKAERLGFRAFAAGSDEGGVPERRPLIAVDVEREAGDLREGFGRRIARDRAADLVAICAEWQPDVLVWEETDFGAAIAAERRGLPHASVIVLAAATYVRQETFAPVLDEVRAEHGLPADPDLAMLSRHLVIAPIAPSFRDPSSPLPPGTVFVRPTVRQPTADEVAPAWLDQLDDVPTVYVTLGTVFHVESGDLFTRVVTGLRELPINVVVTVGNEVDPAELGPQPANVHIERFIPQAFVLPRCDLVLSHGGSGSVIGALIHGVPMVLI
ncbi:MAG: glycosyltransferase, partial [Chloroflexota bacterium]